MKKIILILLTVFTVCNFAQAKSAKNDLSGVIRDSGVDTHAISVSIKDANNGKPVYSLNDKILMHPASVQKILTMPVAYEQLGSDYKFKTQLYKRNSDTYLIKLGADPYLTSNDLKTLAKSVPAGIQQMLIDDKILDDKTWGEGWQWDDDLNPLMPRFGAYNLDKNIAKISIFPAKTNGTISIVNNSKYPFVFINNIKDDNITKIETKRDNGISANTITFNGSIARPVSILIPINNIRLYFDIKLNQSLEDRKIYIRDSFKETSLTSKDVFVTEIEHELNTAIDDIFKNSNNLTAETVFKLAGGKYAKSEGSDIAGVELFNSYCKKNKLDNSRIRIVDGSGVSKNNLMSADFVSDFLILNKKNPIMDELPHPGEGTMALRLLPMKNNLKAKTGTLSDVSSLAGYLTSKSGNQYVFCIMINDRKQSPSDKKMLEDYIIKEAYLRL